MINYDVYFPDHNTVHAKHFNNPADHSENQTRENSGSLGHQPQQQVISTTSDDNSCNPHSDVKDPDQQQYHQGAERSTIINNYFQQQHMLQQLQSQHVHDTSDSHDVLGGDKRPSEIIQDENHIQGLSNGTAEPHRGEHLSTENNGGNTDDSTHQHPHHHGSLHALHSELQPQLSQLIHSDEMHGGSNHQRITDVLQSHTSSSAGDQLSQGVVGGASQNNSSSHVGTGGASNQTGFRRGSLQLWQFLVALLHDPVNTSCIAWTGRGMEFKLIEPEEVGDR